MEFIGKLPFGLKAEAGVSLSRGFVVWAINSRIDIYIYNYLPSTTAGRWGALSPNPRNFCACNTRKKHFYPSESLTGPL